MLGEILGFGGSVLGGLFGGGDETQTTKMEPWAPLQGYIVGEDGPNHFYPTPLNYNWVDWSEQAGAGAPGSWLSSPPPMSMNDPRMTYENMYYPYGDPGTIGGGLLGAAGINGNMPPQQESAGNMPAGGNTMWPGQGPWGHGYGPGVPVQEVGVGTQPGNRFVQTPQGFTPGPVNPQAPPQQPQGIGDVDSALEFQKWYNLQGSMMEQPDSVNSLQALQYMQQNPDTNYQDWTRTLMGDGGGFRFGG